VNFKIHPLLKEGHEKVEAVSGETEEADFLNLDGGLPDRINYRQIA
jgi:hypothetical protein